MTPKIGGDMIFPGAPPFTSYQAGLTPLHIHIGITIAQLAIDDNSC